ncbi:MAG: hypothetical protein JWP45_666 [Mucilaginibacter sp.]|nr:hypothetical protein [Mucilaginibacter sp.]
MTNVIINQDSINSLLINVGERIKAFDQSITIIRFGSSLDRLQSNYLDIDILLLSDEDYLGETVGESIRCLRERLILGNATQGFDTQVREIVNTVHSELKSCDKSEAINYMPKFIFGPMPYDSNDADKINVYLHFKGPLNTVQFEMFCKEMPLHAYSLIHNHGTIFGSLDVRNFERSLILNNEILDLFNAGLEIRVNQSNNTSDIIKCIRKLILNYRASKGIPVTIHSDSNDLDSWKLKNLSELKQIFIQLLSQFAQ